MGKAGKRKKNRQKRKDQHAPLHGSGDSGSLSSVISNPQSAVHRLRHTDPKTRHEALVALQASVLSQIRCGGGSRQVSLKVLQAVREQVTSNDLECSAVAADCLAQYLSAISSFGDSDMQTDQHKQMTASWALVLLGRLNDCRKALVEQQRTQSPKKISENQRKKAEKIKKQWYAVSAPCFIALCQLIEKNGHALNQINLQKKTFVEVVFGLLLLGIHTSAEGASSSNGQASMTGKDMTMRDDSEEKGTGVKVSARHDTIFEELKKTTELYAARSLHSALDDNWELAEVLTDGESEDAWKALFRGVSEEMTNQNTNELTANALSTTTRLHLIGSLVNLYQLSLYSENRHDTASWPEEVLLEYGLKIDENQGLLTQVLFCRENQSDDLLARLSNQEDKYRKAETLLDKQKDDQKLEAEVDAKVRERKEPAKLIARRQKKFKEAKREERREQQKAKMIAEAERSLADTGMMDVDDGDDNGNDQTSGKITNREQDGEEAVSEALLEWTNSTGKIQLALEILTNLVSTWISAPEGQEGGDEPMSTCDASNASKSFMSKSFQLVNSIDVASRLVSMLQSFCQFLRDGKRGKQRDDDPIRLDVEEMIGKASGCLINCILSGIITSTTNSVTANSDCPARDAVLNPILRDLHTELNGSRGNDEETPVANYAVVDAYAAVLVVILETNPGILHQENDNPNLFQDYIALFQQILPRRDAVCLLSATVLTWAESAGTTPAKAQAMVRSITEKYLELLLRKTNSNDAEARTALVNTQTQVLKTFMDWYGKDTFYPQLYNEMQVSTAIASCLTSISNELNKSSISGKSLDIDEEQMEILHNSERFIEYKKNLQRKR
eukprot:jgi/Psemu1/254525/estExt_Genewise1Plus.C_1020049